eukprot:m.223353 g.223353  ORF g.223353 m.223353 type:complete len:817 (-) comp26343_c4_seq2:51-2501(-)
MQAINKRDLEGLQFMLDRMRPVEAERAGLKALSLLVHVRDFDFGLLLFEELGLRKFVNHDLTVQTALLHIACGRVAEFHQFLQRLPDFRLQPTAAMYDAGINHCLTARNLNLALDLWQDCLARQIKLSPRLVATAIRTFSRLDSIPTALSVLELVTESSQRQQLLTAQSFVPLIAGFVRGQSKEDFQSIVQVLRAFQLPLNEAIVSHVVRGCQVFHLPEVYANILNDFPDSLLPMSLSVGVDWIRDMAIKGKNKATVEYLTQVLVDKVLETPHIPISVPLAQGLLLSVIKNSQGQLLLPLVRLLARKLGPHAIPSHCYITGLRQLVMRRRLNLCFEFYNCLKEMSVPLNEGGGAVISAFVSSGDLHQALNVTDELQRTWSYEPDVTSLYPLLYCSFEKLNREAMRYFIDYPIMQGTTVHLGFASLAVRCAMVLEDQPFALRVLKQIWDFHGHLHEDGPYKIKSRDRDNVSEKRIYAMQHFLRAADIESTLMADALARATLPAPNMGLMALCAASLYRNEAFQELHHYTNQIVLPALEDPGLDILRQPGSMVDSTRVLVLLSRAFLFSEAVRLFDLQCVQPDSLTVVSVLMRVKVCATADEARATLLDLMERLPNEVFVSSQWNVVVHKYVQEGRFEDAVDCIRTEMVEANRPLCRPDWITWRTILHSHDVEGRDQAARAQMAAMALVEQTEHASGARWVANSSTGPARSASQNKTLAFTSPLSSSSSLSSSSATTANIEDDDGHEIEEELHEEHHEQTELGETSFHDQHIYHLEFHAEDDDEYNYVEDFLDEGAHIRDLEKFLRRLRFKNKSGGGL